MEAVAVRIGFVTRLWLAWRVLTGKVQGASWDARADSVRIDFQDRRAFDKRMRGDPWM